MKLTIHRGTNQIGGCVTEYQLGNWKLFVDFGEQLPGAPISDEPLLIDGLNCGDTSHSALLITHNHGDHIGKLLEVDPSVPLYIGGIAEEIYNKLQERLSYIKNELGEKASATIERLKTVNTFQDGDKIEFGPFIIRPHNMDHSAFDAYCFLISNKDDENDIVLHTGDFRTHGWRGQELFEKLNTLPAVKALICEGTNIDKENISAETEQMIEERFTQHFKENKYNVVFAAASNIDRIFTIYRAAVAAGRFVLMDKYQESIINDIVEHVSKTNSATSQVYTPFKKENYLALDYDKCSKTSLQFFYNDKLQNLVQGKGCVLIARSTQQYLSLIDKFTKEKTKRYLSMWSGYIDSENPAYNEALANAVGNEYEHIHTSGHADLQALEELFSRVQAEKIIPMHTANPDKFIEHFPEKNICILKDGETIEL